MVMKYIVSGGPKDREKGEFNPPVTEPKEVLGAIVGVNGHNYVCIDVDSESVATLKW